MQWFNRVQGKTQQLISLYDAHNLFRMMTKSNLFYVLLHRMAQLNAKKTQPGFGATNTNTLALFPPSGEDEILVCAPSTQEISSIINTARQLQCFLQK